MSGASAGPHVRLVDQFETGLDAPICLTWELTYACNLACVHCLSSSGGATRASSHRGVPGGDRRARADAGVLRQHRRRRADGPQGLLGARRLRDRPPRRGEVLDQRQSHHARSGAAWLAAQDYVDVQISLDGATAEVNDAIRGPGSYATAIEAMEHLAAAGIARLQAVGRRHARRTSSQLDAFKAIADRYRRAAADHAAASVRSRRGRVGRAAPDPDQQRELYDWLLRPRRARC